MEYRSEKNIEDCYWFINPESGDAGGLYGHACDPETNESGLGEWLDFIQEKAELLTKLWGN